MVYVDLQRQRIGARALASLLLTRWVIGSSLSCKTAQLLGDVWLSLAKDVLLVCDKVKDIHICTQATYIIVLPLCLTCTQLF